MRPTDDRLLRKTSLVSVFSLGNTHLFPVNTDEAHVPQKENHDDVIKRGRGATIARVAVMRKLATENRDFFCVLRYL